MLLLLRSLHLRHSNPKHQNIVSHNMGATGPAPVAVVAVIINTATNN